MINQIAFLAQAATQMVTVRAFQRRFVDSTGMSKDDDYEWQDIEAYEDENHVPTNEDRLGCILRRIAQDSRLHPDSYEYRLKPE